jgi:hypothetical protein
MPRYGPPGRDTSAPSEPALSTGWNQVGDWGGHLGTPIAANFFLTTKHVGGAVGGSITFLDSTSYQTVSRFDDPASDLALWRISGSFDPAKIVPLSTDSTVAGNAPLVIFGRGTARADTVFGNAYGGGTELAAESPRGPARTASSRSRRLSSSHRRADLVPPPRKHQRRYHGVFAPNHKLRQAVTALAKRQRRQAGRCHDRREWEPSRSISVWRSAGGRNHGGGGHPNARSTTTRHRQIACGTAVDRPLLSQSMAGRCQRSWRRDFPLRSSPGRRGLGRALASRSAVHGPARRAEGRAVRRGV